MGFQVLKGKFCYPQTATLAVPPFFPPVLVLSSLTTGGSSYCKNSLYKKHDLLHLFSTVHLSRGPSPISLSTQEAWPVAAAITEYINAYFKGGQHNRSAWSFFRETNHRKQKRAAGLISTQHLCFCLPPDVWWRSRATWRCPSLQASLGFSQPTPTSPCSASGWSTSRGSITSCQIKSCSTGRLPSVFLIQSVLLTVCAPKISRLCVCAVIHLRVTQTPETSGLTCRHCSSTCREKLNSTLRPRTTMLACSNIRSGFKINPHCWYFLLISDILIHFLTSFISPTVKFKYLIQNKTLVLYFTGP